jgi:hypothetical protein
MKDIWHYEMCTSFVYKEDHKEPKSLEQHSIWINEGISIVIEHIHDQMCNHRHSCYAK